MNQECIAHIFTSYMRERLGIDPPWTLPTLTAAIARTVCAEIIMREHPALAGSRLDACCYAATHTFYVVFYRADLAPEQDAPKYLELYPRGLLGQVVPGVPVCYSLCRGTPFADAVLAANLAPQRLVSALSGWTHGSMGAGQASPTEW